MIMKAIFAPSVVYTAIVYIVHTARLSTTRPESFYNSGVVTLEVS